ncbi:MAG TPA: SpoIID/LytB domain-containing protein, partial [Vicinamibacterales bacterium]|nr:SpoIID/LytB domain-containing protein [Vicinamibacterales bacterium]
AERMLEVQAIIARTYAVAHVGRHARDGFDLCATTHCQVYDPSRLAAEWTAAGAAAAARTAGWVLLDGDQPAEALFHADCGGHTSRASSVWGGRDRDYLAAVSDDDVPGSVHTRWEYRARREAIADALNAWPATAFRGPIQSIAIASRDEGGRATKIAIVSAEMREGALTVRAEDFRQALTRAFGAQSIRSTKFEVRQDGGWYAFAGQGFGHGVGLCQAGAFARLRAGAMVRDVLAFYYPGTSVSHARVTRP